MLHLAQEAVLPLVIGCASGALVVLAVALAILDAIVKGMQKRANQQSAQLPPREHWMGSRTNHLGEN